MNGYTKLFQSILTSSVWGHTPEIKVVWITLLALSDKKGYVAASLPGIARMAGVPIEVCQQAIEIFESPDQFSRSPEHEGRRIQKVEGGWVLLNHEKYRDTLNMEDRREYFRIKKREERERRARVKAMLDDEKRRKKAASEDALADMPSDMKEKILDQAGPAV